MNVEARLVQKMNPASGQNEYALVSKDGSRVLKWFGTKRPSDEEVKERERQVQYFKHKGGTMNAPDNKGTEKTAGYQSVNDAVRFMGAQSPDGFDNTGIDKVLAPGETEVWYYKSDTESYAQTRGPLDDSRLSMGYSLDEQGGKSEYETRIKEELTRLGSPTETHILLGTIAGTNLDEIYKFLQAEFWSPTGGARDLIRRLGLRHTSMDIGDLIHLPDGSWHIVAAVGFNKIAAAEFDEHAARELELFIENDADLYRQQYTPIIKNLMLKRKRGIFDPELAVKLFMYLVDNGALKYAEQFSSGRQDAKRIFSRLTRVEVAKRLRDKFVTEADLGNYDHVLAKGSRRVSVEQTPPASISEVPVSQPTAFSEDMLKGKSLSEIARIIYRDWKNVNYAAKPYLEAMSTLNSIDEKYFLDDGASVVAYFLANATQWRGETARVVKKYLKRMVDQFYKFRRGSYRDVTGSGVGDKPVPEQFGLWVYKIGAFPHNFTFVRGSDRWFTSGSEAKAAFEDTVRRYSLKDGQFYVELMQRNPENGQFNKGVVRQAINCEVSTTAASRNAGRPFGTHPQVKEATRVGTGDRDELRMWVLNDEGLYSWFKDEYPNTDDVIPDKCPDCDVALVDDECPECMTEYEDEETAMEKFLDEHADEIADAINNSLRGKNASVKTALIPEDSPKGEGVPGAPGAGKGQGDKDMQDETPTGVEPGDEMGGDMGGDWTIPEGAGGGGGGSYEDMKMSEEAERRIMSPPDILRSFSPTDMARFQTLEGQLLQALQTHNTNFMLQVEKEMQELVNKYALGEPAEPLSDRGFVARLMKGHLALRRSMIPILKNASTAIYAIMRNFPVVVKSVSLGSVRSGDYAANPEEGVVEWIVSLKRMGMPLYSKVAVLKVVVKGDKTYLKPTIWDVQGKTYPLDSDGVDDFFGMKFQEDIQKIEEGYLNEEKELRKKNKMPSSPLVMGRRPTTAPISGYGGGDMQ